jgi:TatD DNase family protein
MTGAEGCSLGRASWESVELPRRGWTDLRFIDSHVHLGDYEDVQQQLAFASACPGLLVTAGTDSRSSAKGVALSSEHPSLVKAFVGVHPSEAERESEPDWLEGMLRGAAGVGEIGLDPKYSAAGRESAQMRLFRLQLGLAEKARKPVQVHSRGAEGECLEVLGTFDLKAVLLHWFQREEDLARAGGRGHYVSFGPAMLVSKRLRRIASAWDRDRVLVESDGPVGFAALGGIGGSWLLPSVVFELAELFGSSYEETARRIVKNSLEFLGVGGVDPPTAGHGGSKA